MKLFVLESQPRTGSVASLLNLLDQLRSAHDLAAEQNLEEISLQLIDLIIEVAKQIDNPEDC